MLIKSNKGNYCIPPLRNSINDQNIDDTAYDDSDKCELLNKYFSSISKLDEKMLLSHNLTQKQIILFTKYI